MVKDRSGALAGSYSLDCRHVTRLVTNLHRHDVAIWVNLVRDDPEGHVYVAVSSSSSSVTLSTTFNVLLAIQLLESYEYIQ